MIIKSMTATFGKLERAQLVLGDGLNLIHAPNEGGKSTWAAFWKAMLYGIDTRDRDKKGYLADKNRYQPWSGAPMEGELNLLWQGREVTIRRGPKGATPFGAFSAVYTHSQEPVPGLTADQCGQLLTGVGREVFERSAFISAGDGLSVSAAPDLERRIAALVSSGEEDVSYSQTQSQLREWLNRRKVNRSVGQIPKLEGELQQVGDTLTQLEAVTGQIAALEGERAQLEGEKNQLTAEQQVHRRLAQKQLNQRYGQAGQELESAQSQLTALELEQSKYGPLPEKEQLKRAQGELQYLKVLDEEIKQGETALLEAEEVYVQAQIAAQSEHFSGMTGQEATDKVQQDLTQYADHLATAQTKTTTAKLFFPLGVALAWALGAWGFLQQGQLFTTPLYAGLSLFGVFLVIGLVNRSNAKALQGDSEKILARYGVTTKEQLEELVFQYRQCCQVADEAALQAKTLRGTVNDRRARRDNSTTDLLEFVHSFAPQASGLFGCSAALSRALGLEHELAIARERVGERRRRREDLSVQGGRDFDTLEFLYQPQRTPQETDQALAQATAALEQLNQRLNQARGRQSSMGDPAALAAQQEVLETTLDRRTQEYDALTLAISTLTQANTRLQERFSPQLNQLAGSYLAKLTGERYTSVTLNRELEGAAATQEDVMPRSMLYLSRGTVDQLYLAVRLAVCQLCLPQQPPILLDDALTAFDDSRMGLALALLQSLAQQQQILLFTCQRREGLALEQGTDLTRISLS